MSTTSWPGPGLNHVGAYQVSGQPFATGSIQANSEAVKVSFPQVTRWVKIINNSTTDVCKVGFSSAGVQGTNYFTVGKGATKIPVESDRMELKISEIWLYGANGVDVVAGLTAIPVARASTESGTSWSGSSGVG
jgi:hypothetical protein